MAEQEKAPDAVAKLHEGSNRADGQDFEVRRTLMCWTPLRYLGTAEPSRRGWGEDLVHSRAGGRRRRER